MLYIIAFVRFFWGSHGGSLHIFSLIEVRTSNIVIEYRISLSNIEFQMSQRFRVDGDISENAPRVDVDPLLDGDKRCVFKLSGFVWTWPE